MLSTVLKTVGRALPSAKALAQWFILILGVLNAVATVVAAVMPYLPDKKSEPKNRKMEAKDEPLVLQAEESQNREEVVASEGSVPEGQPAQLN
jgi:hypothetical protein